MACGHACSFIKGCAHVNSFVIRKIQYSNKVDLLTVTLNGTQVLFPCQQIEKVAHQAAILPPPSPLHSFSLPSLSLSLVLPFSLFRSGQK